MMMMMMMMIMMMMIMMMMMTTMVYKMLCNVMCKYDICNHISIFFHSL